VDPTSGIGGRAIDRRAERARAPLGRPRPLVRATCWVLDTLVMGLALGYIVGILGLVVLYRGVFIESVIDNPFFVLYGFVVTAYLVSRFAISLAYRPTRDRGAAPSVAIVMPAFNEEAAIGNSLRSVLDLRYRRDALEVVVVDDGSTDDTYAEIQRVAEAEPRVRVVRFAQNRGKRAAMAAGIRATRAEVVVFVDSDSVLEPDALTALVQDFADPRVGAVCGHAEVLNDGAREGSTLIARMQAVRYFVAFRVIKGAESVFGAVTCCSGCFSAYRREAILPWLEWWESQRFLGKRSTFGDDRSLTNCVLRDWLVRYQARAVSRTIVPDRTWKFMRQQMRWKRSWTRESLISASFMWRKHPVASASTYCAIALTLLAPVVVAYSLVWRPIQLGEPPITYLLGIYIISLLYGLYYEIRTQRHDRLWLFGILFVFFNLTVLVWQTYAAILTARTTSWGTRGASRRLPRLSRLGRSGGGP
jgi:hyaluronan synthase